MGTQVRHQHEGWMIQSADGDTPAYCKACGETVQPPAPCPAKDIALGNCSGELGHTGDHYLNTIYGRANWGNDEEDATEPERACVICGTPENGVYTSHNRCCWDADNIEEV